MARALNVPIEALITGHVDETSISFEPVPLFTEMPTSPEVEPNDGKRHTVPIPTNQLPDYRGEYFAYKVPDESMVMAGLMRGAIAVVRYGPVLNNGDIAAVINRGAGLLRYVIFYTNTIVLQPANPTYQATFIPRGDAAAFTVIGKVVLAITPY